MECIKNIEEGTKLIRELSTIQVRHGDSSGLSLAILQTVTKMESDIKDLQNNFNISRKVRQL